MDVSEIVRSARVSAGFDQRTLAAAAGLSRGGLGDIEAGRRRPSWVYLCLLLDACGLELALTRPSPELSPRQKAYLCLSTSERLYSSLGGERHPGTVLGCETWQQLSALSRQGRLSLPSESAIGVWLADVLAPSPLPVVWHGAAEPPLAGDLLTLSHDPAPPAAHLIPAGTYRGNNVWLPTPVALSLQVEVFEHAAGLRAVSRYLHVEEGFDDARRRRPAHRWSSPEREEQDIQDRYAYGNIRARPSSLDRREWRARSVVSFAQWLSINRYPNPRNNEWAV